MTCPAPGDHPIPRLDSLGRDLLRTTPRDRRVACARPFLGVAAYALITVRRRTGGMDHSAATG